MPTSSARITLYLSGDEKIIALPSGTGRRWAETALDLAGFTQNHDLIHTLPLDDQARARQALTHLHQAARDCQVSVATHPRPYLGDIAEAIAVALPDHWQADVLDLREPQDQHYLRDYLWETGSLYTLLDTKPLGFAAILRDGGGTELLLVERPSDGSYMVGALTPSPDHLHATAPAPRSVIASDAQLAARFIQSRLLPDYERAVHLSRLHEVEQDLRWAQEAHEPGTYPTVESQAALYRFRTHAAQGRRREGAEVFERHVAPHANTLLAAARSAVDAMPPARHHAAWRELIDDMAHAADQIRSIRSAPASQPEPDASRVRHLQLWPYVLAWAERSFIISDLAGQHRPVAPPLSGAEQQLWTERAQAAWQRGDLDATDVWYSARNELSTLAYLVEQDERTVVVLAGEMGSEQMRVLGLYATVAEAERAAPPPVPSGVLHPDFAPFKHQPSALGVPRSRS